MMIKVYILVFGLVAVVPEGGGGSMNGATILLLNGDGVTTRWGASIPEHLTTVDLGTGSPIVMTSANDLQDYRISLSPALSGQAMTMVGEDRLLWINDLYGANEPNVPETLAVRAECLPPHSGQACEDNNDSPLLKARVQLSGGWTVRPVEIDENGDAVFMDDRSTFMEDRSTFGFISLNESTPRFAQRVGPLAGGLLFEAEVALADLKVERKTSNGWSPVGVTTTQDCDEFGQTSGECVRIELTNPQKHHHVRLNCDDIGPRRIDEHLDGIYELLEAPPPWRYLPFLVQLDVDDCKKLYPGEPGGAPPNVKCPVGLIGSIE